MGKSFVLSNVDVVNVADVLDDNVLPARCCLPVPAHGQSDSC